jgi:hypothetical protein
MPEQPGHEGTGRYCKENVKAEAIKCKHCGSQIGANTSDCCCNDPEPVPVPVFFGTKTQQFGTRPGLLSEGLWLLHG